MKKILIGLFFSLFPGLLLADSLAPPASDLSVSYLATIFGVVDGVLHANGMAASDRAGQEALTARVVGRSIERARRAKSSSFQSRFESERVGFEVKVLVKKVWLLAGLWICGQVAGRRAIHISIVPQLEVF